MVIINYIINSCHDEYIPIPYQVCIHSGLREQIARISTSKTDHSEALNFYESVLIFRIQKKLKQTSKDFARWNFSFCFCFSILLTTSCARQTSYWSLARPPDDNTET